MAAIATATAVEPLSIDTKDFCEMPPERPARTHVDSTPLPTDSMVSVSLSSEAGTEHSSEEDLTVPDTPKTRHTGMFGDNPPDLSDLEDSTNALEGEDGPKPTVEDKSESEVHSSRESEEDTEEKAEADEEDRQEKETAVEIVDEDTSQRSRSSSLKSSLSTRVDWPELEKTEQAEPKDQVSDESTAFLLAQLEQVNDALATDPKSGLKTFRPRAQSRPPSVHQLRKMVEDPTSPNPRFSMLPSPPPMTELEFWTALVQDYPQTAQRLPTLTSNKIRAGVPPPLRGVVWVSMAGARDIELENKFNSLCNETSPHEGAISKDIGRSFPGVEMFRDADGDGQRMLARVLSTFSLYDPKIGYCQGLGFLVGPLLMQMGDREAFCVLVRFVQPFFSS